MPQLLLAQGDVRMNHICPLFWVFVSPARNSVIPRTQYLCASAYNSRNLNMLSSSVGALKVYGRFAAGEDEGTPGPPKLKEGGKHFVCEICQGAAFIDSTKKQMLFPGCNEGTLASFSY